MNVDAPSRPRVVGPYTTFVTSVARTARLGANFMRVTLAGGDLVDFAPVGPDTFAYLLLPPPGRRDLSIDASFTWDLYRELPELDRPVGAYYTIRAWRPEAAEVDLDMVLHGDAGAGSAWATQARPGDPVALWGPRALYTPVETDEWQLLVGDETTLPAIATILESLDASARAIAVIEIGNETERQPLESAADVEIHWVDRGAAPAGTSELLVEKVRTLELPTTKGYAWGGGESHSMTAIRRHLRDVCGLPATDVCVVAYWRHADHAPDDDD